MKKNTTLFACLLVVSTLIFSNPVKAQQSCPWAKTAGGTYEDYGTAVTTDASGNVYYLGNFNSVSIKFGAITLHNEADQVSGGGAAMYLVKYDSCGTVIWAKAAVGDYDAVGSCLTSDAAGNIYVGGYFNSDTLKLGAVNLLNVGGSYNAFIAKYNSSGVAQWAKGGSGDAQNYLNAIALDGSNNIYVSGTFQSTALSFGTTTLKNGYSNGYDIFTAKFDNNGNAQWIKGGAGDNDDQANGRCFRKRVCKWCFLV